MMNLVEELVVTSMTVSLINVNTMVLEVQGAFCYNILIGHINKKLYVVRHQYNIVLRKHFKLEIDSAYLHYAIMHVNEVYCQPFQNFQNFQN